MLTTTSEKPVQEEGLLKVSVDFAMQSGQAKSPSNFSEMLKLEFAKKKKLKVLDLGAGSSDFLINMKTILKKAGFEPNLRLSIEYGNGLSLIRDLL